MPSRERISNKGAKGCATHAKGRPQASFVLASIGKRPRVDCTDMIWRTCHPTASASSSRSVAGARAIASEVAQIFPNGNVVYEKKFSSPALALAAAKYRKIDQEIEYFFLGSRNMGFLLGVQQDKKKKKKKKELDADRAGNQSHRARASPYPDPTRRARATQQ